MRLFMIPGTGVDLVAPVDLLQQHHPQQVMGEGHGGHGQFHGCLGLDGGVHAEGAADEEHQMALTPVGGHRHFDFVLGVESLIALCKKYNKPIIIPCTAAKVPYYHAKGVKAFLASVAPIVFSGIKSTGDAVYNEV